MANINSWKLYLAGMIIHSRTCEVDHFAILPEFWKLYMMHFITNSTYDLSKEEDVQRFEYTGSCPVK
jgi:hypothetical protein